MVKVAVVGSIALDSIETMYGSRRDVLGGSATFISIASSYLAPTGVVGIIGTDFPTEGRTFFERLGVDTTGLETAEGATFRWVGRYHQDMIGRDTLATNLGVFENFRPQVPDVYRSAPYVVLGNIHPGLQLHFLDQIPRAQFVVADTMKLWIDSAAEELGQVIKRSHLFIVNDEEARQITGEVNLARAAQALLARGPSYVVIKRGEHGASLHHAHGCFYVPAVPLLEVKDPTGAGDSFLGGLIGFIARMDRLSDEVLRQALVVAGAMASFTVEDFSVGRLAVLEKTELLERCGQIRSMTGVGHIDI